MWGSFLAGGSRIRDEAARGSLIDGVQPASSQAEVLDNHSPLAEPEKALGRLRVEPLIEPWFASRDRNVY